MNGRRIYIHEGSFTHLAALSTPIARRVFRAIAAIRALKVLNHHLEQATELDLIQPATAVAIETELASRWRKEMTEFLHNVGYRPRDPQRREEFHSLLAEREAIIATCEDSGYLTFATSEASACTMYEDHVPLKALRRDVTAGTGPHDLTMVWGQSLALIDAALGVGPTLGPQYALLIGAQSVSPDDLSHVRSEEARRLLSEVHDFVRRAAGLQRDERKVIDGFVSALDSTFLRAAPLSPDAEQAS